MKRDKSIIQKDMTRCYVCGTTLDLHTHEIFYGTANRKQSIKYGCYVRLCGRHHNLSNEGVHFDKKLDELLKQTCQRKFEETHSRDDFIRIFGKSYI